MFFKNDFFNSEITFISNTGGRSDKDWFCKSRDIPR